MILFGILELPSKLDGVMKQSCRTSEGLQEEEIAILPHLSARDWLVLLLHRMPKLEKAHQTFFSLSSTDVFQPLARLEFICAVATAIAPRSCRASWPVCQTWGRLDRDHEGSPR